MDHGSGNPEPVKVIQEERMLEAQRRREASLRLLKTPLSEYQMMRMALGPGIQFAGVTERLLDTVTNRAIHHPAH